MVGASGLWESARRVADYQEGFGVLRTLQAIGEVSPQSAPRKHQTDGRTGLETLCAG